MADRVAVPSARSVHMSAGGVLVVEDDEAIRRLLGTVLESRGYEVHEVGDGRSALPAARACRPEVILLDVGLPGMDGFGVLELLKADEELCEVPVLMLTAWAEPALITKALDRGAHDCVRKPFDIHELAARVDAAARVKARQDALSEDNERLNAIATTDPLTTAATRPAATEALEREIARADRSGAPLSVLLLDLDHFKAANDTHGDAVGDAVLRAVGRRLQTRLRRGDVLGRWSGEEFVVIAPGTDLDGALTLAEALRGELSARPIDTRAAAIRTTVSLGVVEWGAGETPDALLDRCDRALHVARSGGRNRVEAGDAPEPRMRLAS
jgi:two-component system, cell cycle response regulator